VSKRELSEKDKQELVERATEVVLEKMNAWINSARDKGMRLGLAEAFMDGVQWCASTILAEGFLDSL